MQFFDSLTHPTISGDWYKHEDSSFETLDHFKSSTPIAYKACAVNNPLFGCDNRSFYNLCSKRQWIFPVAGINSLDNIEQQFDELIEIGYTAVKLHPRELCITSLKQAEEVFDRCHKENIKLFLCTYYFSKITNWPTTDYLNDLAAIFNQSPCYTILLHGGGVRLLEFAEFVRFNHNCLLDLSLTINKYAGSSIDSDIRFLLHRFDQRICVGTDHPENSIESVIKRIQDLQGNLDKEKLNNILYKNLKNFLSI